MNKREFESFINGYKRGLGDVGVAINGYDTYHAAPENNQAWREGYDMASSEYYDIDSLAHNHGYNATYDNPYQHQLSVWRQTAYHTSYEMGVRSFQHLKVKEKNDGDGDY